MIDDNGTVPEGGKWRRANVDHKCSIAVRCKFVEFVKHNLAVHARGAEMAKRFLCQCR